MSSLLRKALQMAARVFLVRRKVLLQADVRQIRRVSPKIPATFRIGEMSDMDNLSATLYGGDFGASTYSWERLAAGDEVFLGELDGEIVFAGWVMFGQLDLAHGELIPIGKDSVASYRLHTRVDQRGNRLCPAYLSVLAEKLQEIGYRRVLSWVEMRNTTSLKLHERAGFERMGSFWQVRILSRSWFFIPKSVRQQLQPAVHIAAPVAMAQAAGKQ